VERVTQQAILRAKDLISKGNNLVTTPMANGVAGRPQVDTEEFFGWSSQSLSFLEGLLGKSHVYVESFRPRCETPQPYNAHAGTGILQSVLEDLEHGYLSTLPEMVHASTFADFLEMAEYLLKDGGYKDAAAVMAGGALEAHLRNLCEKHGIDTHRMTPDGSVPKKADTLNADLARAAVYSKLDQKSVTAWLDLRNNAAHGHYGAYSSEQVVLLIQGIRDFISRLPA
jgi:hypothetical protein